ncbi:DNA-3-methyladenine glycosylase I [Streptococcus chenjunshii]|uniref:DNA-3-methyladenine glycosylase I n=1 Tax=Streptococcus chenjunshii TaxID=2173853 RepID=A0A372KPG9_9STRE|nr:DNA-3-methyladenine glycosylase I [Streptococcus chenjunshii]AXQ79606.1 DNA-3-methyladenine glycosylase I [Streptococcus chenjunshii]RFU51521.1 DNA-3-methyladenine glycosylase I [Streptococcus chenjunshii]RFU53498.1 DNA-3-methyladenine glycosylase I [Streptococcus chenjunshii]
MKRCGWVKENNPLYVEYHDKEWGQPLHDERALFELFCLETYQAGLSWETVLNKRSAFKQVFADYEIEKVAAMSDDQLEAILENPNIIRNRLKIFATRANAQAFLEIQKKFGSFDSYIWTFVGYETIHNQIADYKMAPAKTALSEKIAKDLKKQGCKFVGPVAVYSFLQAAGLVNDHEENCVFNPAGS